MTDQTYSFIAHLALSLQRGLLGSILPEMRAIGTSYKEGVILIYCIVDGEPSEVLINEIEDVAADVIADLSDTGYSIETHIERVDMPALYNKVDPRVMRWVYSRYEDDESG